MNSRLLSKKSKIWTSIGKLIYYCAWPAIYLIIRLSPKRTRILVISEGKLLLTKDWIGTGAWSIPGGGLHVNENLKTGALRELREETGLKLNPKDLYPLGDMKVNNNCISTKLIIFKVEFIKKPKVISGGIEIIDHKWVGMAELNNIKIDNSSRKIIDSFPSASSLIQ